jgi:hypothetical protein
MEPLRRKLNNLGATTNNIPTGNSTRRMGDELRRIG